MVIAFFQAIFIVQDLSIINIYVYPPPFPHSNYLLLFRGGWTLINLNESQKKRNLTDSSIERPGSRGKSDEWQEIYKNTNIFSLKKRGRNSNIARLQPPSKWKVHQLKISGICRVEIFFCCVPHSSSKCR